MGRHVNEFAKMHSCISIAITEGMIIIGSFLSPTLAVQLETDLVKGNQQVVQAWNTLPLGTSSIDSLAWDQGIAIYGGQHCPLNGAVGLGVSGPVTGQALDRVESFYASHRHPSIVRVSSLADGTLIALTGQRGYVLTAFSHRWVLDLASWKSMLAAPDARVHRANPGEEMLWARTVASGFSPEDTVQGDPLALERAFFRMSSGIPVIAFEHGHPAGAGMLALNDGIAALFATSTRLSFRRKGLHLALLDWRLRYAQQQGMRWATIETEPGSDSQRNVERIGFRLAYVTAELSHPLLQG